MAISSEHLSKLRDNLGRVRAAIAAAASRCGRSSDSVRLVAVTKYVPLEVIAALIDLGCFDVGESRPQQLWDRAAGLARLRPDANVAWHQIGSLQRNKAARTAGVAAWIHSLDSARLLEALAAPRSPPVRCLVEVNVAGEASKHGLAPDDLLPLLESTAAVPGVSLVGLMTMAPLDGGLDAARRTFAALRQLRDSLRPRLPPHLQLDELSMGMSGDFEVAIEEGATLVRVGSALFTGLDPA